MADDPPKQTKKPRGAENNGDRRPRKGAEEPITKPSDELETIEKRGKKPKQQREKHVDDEEEIKVIKENSPKDRMPKKREKQILEELEVEDPPSARKPKKPRTQPNAGSSNAAPKTRNLAQSRKWDQEDLEVLVPEEEHSSDEELKGITEKEEETTNFATMSAEEKAKMDWLTGVVPDEVLRNIYRYLDAPEIDQTALVCKRTNELAQEKSVWKVYRGDWEFVTKDQFSKANSRNAFARLYNFEMSQREQRRLNIEAHEWAEHLANQSEWAKGWMTLFLFNRSVDYFSVICFILGTCFATARCQLAIDWNWRLVLLPFYIPMFQLLVTPLIYDLCRTYYTSANVDDATESEMVIWHFLFVSNRKYRRLLYASNLLLLVFWILLMVKLNDNLNGIPAGVCIIPLLILLVLVFLEQITGWASGANFWDGKAWDRCFIMFSMPIIALVLLFLVFKLDGVVNWTWPIILIPLWTYFGFCLIFPWIALCASACSWSCKHELGLAYAEGTWFAFMAHTWCYVILAAPLLTWFILTCLNLGGYAHRNWGLVFIPIFIVEVIVLAGCGVLDLINWCDN